MSASPKPSSDSNWDKPDLGLSLLPKHARLVQASAIAPAVAEACGSRSVTRRAEPKGLGFSERTSCDGLAAFAEHDLGLDVLDLLDA